MLRLPPAALDPLARRCPVPERRQCVFGTCLKSFHVLCGRAAGQQLMFRASDGEPLPFCDLHSKPAFEKMVRCLHVACSGGPDLAAGVHRLVAAARGRSSAGFAQGAECLPPSPLSCSQVEEYVDGKRLLELRGTPVDEEADE